MKSRIRSFFIELMEFHWIKCISLAIGIAITVGSTILLNFIFGNEAPVLLLILSGLAFGMIGAYITLSIIFKIRELIEKKRLIEQELREREE